MRYSSLPTETLQPWAFLNNVVLSGVQVQPNILTEDGSDKGGGLVAIKDCNASDIVLTIPTDLILNRTAVDEAAKIDSRLREILDAVGPSFLKKPRVAIMLFLLLQLTYSSPDLGGNSVGSRTSFSDYAKFLPKDVPLPTVFTEEEQQWLVGTSLEAALSQKLQRLESEFEHLQSTTQHISWCNTCWWDKENGVLTLQDWKIVDAMYRSRALELPTRIGDSMVPVLDMANHATDDKHNARFQLSEEGHVQLVIRDNRTVKPGEEVTIMYGYGGACEMIFSYGFLEKGAQSAREMFLDLTIPPDDPLKRAKINFAREAPGVRVYTDEAGQVRWESSFVWWACINEEDGLLFRIIQGIDGSMELKATWRDGELEADNLRKVLEEEPLWNLFLLRAIVLIQQRVETQGHDLSNSQQAFDQLVDHGDRTPMLDTIARLRDLEMKLLSSSYQELEDEKTILLDSDSVRAYLNQQDPNRADGEVDEDFS